MDNDIVRRIMALFEGYDGAYGTHGATERNPEKHDKLEIKKTARTIHAQVTPELWEAHLEGRAPIGIIPVRRDNTCVWGCIDVDRYDLDYADVVKKVRDLGLPLVVCRTKSGGVHLYLFMSEPIPAGDIQAKLRDWAALLGFGGCEIFPKQAKALWEAGDMANWLNMPYFGGDSTERYCVNEKGRGVTLRQFLAVAEGSRRTEGEILDMRPAAAADDEFKDGPPCLQYLATTGFPDGTRNNGLFALGTFLKRKHPDKWEIMLEQFNAKYMTPPLQATEVMGVAKSLRSKDYKYKCSDMPLANHCNSGLCRVRKYGVGAAASMPTIDSLATIKSDEPVWFLNVGGERIELTTTELLTPTLFQKKCLETIQVLVPVLKRETWTALIQGLMDDMTIIEVPPEVSSIGQFFEHLESFCTDRQRAQTQDEIILGKAWHDTLSGRIYFRLRDVQEYLERVKFKGMTRTMMTSRIKERGGGTHFFNIKGRGVNVFWLPDEIFEVQTEPHDLPKSMEEVL